MTLPFNNADAIDFTFANHDYPPCPHFRKHRYHLVRKNWDERAIEMAPTFNESRQNHLPVEASRLPAGLLAVTESIYLPQPPCLSSTLPCFLPRCPPCSSHPFVAQTPMFSEMLSSGVNNTIKLDDKIRAQSMLKWGKKPRVTDREKGAKLIVADSGIKPRRVNPEH